MICSRIRQNLAERMVNCAATKLSASSATTWLKCYLFYLCSLFALGQGSLTTRDRGIEEKSQILFASARLAKYFLLNGTIAMLAVKSPCPWAIQMLNPSHTTSRVVLHVDDDPQLTRLVDAMLRTRGIECFSLNDSEKAIAQLLSGEHRVVILDIDMPGINGLELLRRIKEDDGGVQVIMLTGLVTISTVMQSLELGAEACLFKPLNNIDPLVEAIECAFSKVDRWWEALRILTKRRREDGCCRSDYRSRLALRGRVAFLPSAYK